MDQIDKSKPGWWNTARAKQKTHCNNGHALIEENVFTRPGKPGRFCRTCRDQSSKYHRARNKRNVAARHFSEISLETL